MSALHWGAQIFDGPGLFNMLRVPSSTGGWAIVLEGKLPALAAGVPAPCMIRGQMHGIRTDPERRTHRTQRSTFANKTAVTEQSSDSNSYTSHDRNDSAGYKVRALWPTIPDLPAVVAKRLRGPCATASCDALPSAAGANEGAPAARAGLQGGGEDSGLVSTKVFSQPAPVAGQTASEDATCRHCPGGTGLATRHTVRSAGGCTQMRVYELSGRTSAGQGVVLLSLPAGACSRWSTWRTGGHGVQPAPEHHAEQPATQPDVHVPMHDWHGRGVRFMPCSYFIDFLTNKRAELAEQIFSEEVTHVDVVRVGSPAGAPPLCTSRAGGGAAGAPDLCTEWRALLCRHLAAGRELGAS